MPRKSVLWVFGVLTVAFAILGIVGIVATGPVNNAVDQVANESAPLLHSLNHLRSASAWLVLAAEELTLEGGVADTPAEGGDALLVEPPFDSFRDAYATLQESLAQYETLADDGDSSRTSLSEAGKDLLDHAEVWQKAYVRGDHDATALHMATMQTAQGEFRRQLEKITGAVEEELERSDALVSRLVVNARLIGIVATGLAIILAIVFGSFVSRLAAGERATQKQLRIDKDELERQVEERTVALRQANEQLQQEVTKLKNAEEALRQSEQRFRTAAEGALVGIFIIQDNQFRYVNPSLAQMVEYRPGELINTISPLDLIHPEDRPRAAARLQQRMGGEPAQRPLIARALARDGRLVHFESLARPVLFEGRQAVIGTLMDVTARTRDREEIERRNRELLALLSASQQLAGTLNLEWRLETVTKIAVATLLNADAASLWLLDDSSGELSLRARTGYPERDQIVDNGHWAPMPHPAELLYQLGELDLADNLDGTAFLLATTSEQSILGVPLHEDGQVIGILLAASLSCAEAFEPRDAQLLQSIAGQATVAIKNALLIEALNNHRQELQRLSADLLAAREAESKRLSRELHDVMGQALSALTINLAKMKQELASGAMSAAEARLDESTSLAAEILSQVRSISLDLRPSMLDDLGLLPTLRWYVHQFGKRLQIDTRLEAKGIRRRLAPEIETALYRIIQEGLTNVAHHADAQRVAVRLECDGQILTLTLTDDGRGFDRRALAGRNDGRAGLGLLSLRERAAAVGGELEVTSAPGEGTCIALRLPCPPAMCEDLAPSGKKEVSHGSD